MKFTDIEGHFRLISWFFQPIDMMNIYTLLHATHRAHTLRYAIFLTLYIVLTFLRQLLFIKIPKMYRPNQFSGKTVNATAGFCYSASEWLIWLCTFVFRSAYLILTNQILHCKPREHPTGRVYTTKVCRNWFRILLEQLWLQTGLECKHMKLPATNWTFHGTRSKSIRMAKLNVIQGSMIFPWGDMHPHALTHPLPPYYSCIFCVCRKELNTFDQDGALILCSLGLYVVSLGLLMAANNKLCR